jgi:hypothetical protein
VSLGNVGYQANRLNIKFLKELVKGFLKIDS